MRSIPSPEGADDASTTIKLEYLRVSRGPMMRARAKRLKDAMMMLMKESGEAFNCLEELKEEEKCLWVHLVRRELETSFRAVSRSISVAAGSSSSVPT